MAEYLKEIDEARRDLLNIMVECNCAPIMLRLAWNDAGTYDAQSKTGGPNGSIRNEEEYTHGANTGLKLALDLCEDVKSKHPCISYADLYQLAGVVAVEASGGPIISFKPGRQDSNICPEEGRLPDAIATLGSQPLRDVFYRMGLSDKDTVVLAGAHTLGRAHAGRSGFDVPWTQESHFDNSYFVELLKKEASDGLLNLPTDKALLEDPEFHRYVELYAEDEEKFIIDYSESHRKLSELGFNRSSEAEAAAAAAEQNIQVVEGIFEKDVVMNTETGAVGVVFGKRVYPVSEVNSFPLERDEVTVLDRNFAIGHIVSRVGEPTTVGVVVSMSKKVTLSGADGGVMDGIPTERLQRTRSFFKGDTVIHRRSNWIGVVFDTDLKITVEYSDGVKTSGVDPNPQVLKPVFTNALERVTNKPYQQGQAVEGEFLRHGVFKCVPGVVTKHKTQRVHVNWWFCKGQAEIPRPETDIIATEVRRLMPPLFASADWYLGDRCFVEVEEFLICNVTPSVVRVRWRDGGEEEIDARLLVAVDTGGLFFDDGFDIGDLVCRKEVVGELPVFGIVSGINDRVAKIAWQDGTTGVVDHEDIENLQADYEIVLNSIEEDYPHMADVTDNSSTEDEDGSAEEDGSTEEEDGSAEEEDGEVSD